jgi:hypothetical protein
VKEKRKGPIGRAAAVAEGLAATVRRMQREREPRLLVYDETGYARLVQPNGRGYERLLETAERMVALTDEAEVKRPEEAEPEAGTEGEAAPKPRRSKRAAANGGEAKGKPKPPRAKRAAPKAGGAAEPRRTGRAAGAGGEAGAARPKRAAKPARPKRAGSGKAEPKPRRARRREAPSGDDE